MTNFINFKPPVIAHRGASAYAPENTLIAFTKAAQLGIKWIEFDVEQAACGEPVIFHDEELDRTTNAHGDISQFEYAYLRTLDAGAWFDPRFAGEPIPNLRQVIEFLQTNKMSANVEIKALPGKEKQLVRSVLDEMRAYLTIAGSRILFSSFSVAALEYLREMAPNCQMGLLLHEWEPDWEKTCSRLQCVSVHVNEEIMTEPMAKKIKNLNKALLCYTVNDPIRAKELFAWGVDAVFSDMPDKIIS